jgi:hypothetical protein
MMQLKLSTNAFYVGFPSWTKCSFICASLAQKYMAFDVSRSTSGTLIKDVTAASFDGQAAMAAH